MLLSMGMGFTALLRRPVIISMRSTLCEDVSWSPLVLPDVKEGTAEVRTLELMLGGEVAMRWAGT